MIFLQSVLQVYWWMIAIEEGLECIYQVGTSMLSGKLSLYHPIKWHSQGLSLMHSVKENVGT